MIQKIYKMTFLVFLLVFSINQAEAQVEFKIEVMPDNVTYQVSMRPTVTWNPPMNITSSGQVTIKAPTGGFVISNTSSVVPSTSWSHNSTYNNPIEDPFHDYFSFGLTSLGTSAFSYDAGVETPIFTFQNSGTCTGPVELMAAGDPFYPPNSQNGNAGCQITTFGGGQMNAWIGNYDLMSANCGGVAPPPTCQFNSVTPSAVSDCDADDGSISVSASSNTSLEYSIDNGDTFQVSPLFENLAGGDYTVVIRTSGGVCTSLFAGNPVTVSEPTAVTINSSSQNPSNCGTNDGSITLTGAGGTGNLEYSINGTDYFASGNFTNLTPGNYPVSVRNTDETCVVSGGTVMLSSPSSPFFSGINNTNPTLCGVNNGTISISAMGGSGSYEYSINDTDYFPSGSFTGLTAGTYPISIRNSDGTCTISGAAQTLTAPSALSVSVSTTNPSICNTADGQIQVSATGGTGNYLYSINNGASYSQNGMFTGLAAGNYTVLVKNSDDSCETTSLDNPVTLVDPACPGSCLVDYILEALPDGRYQVSILPHVTWNMPENLTSTAQVTMLAPAGGFVVNNVTNLIPGVVFEHNATYAAPNENTSQDYFVFGLTSQATQGISYQAGVKVPLFTFDNGGICTDDEVFLLDNNSDPFLPPNSQNGNVGQQLSTLGGGIDIEICTSALGVPCQTPVIDLSCTVAYQLELLPDGLYQVSLIPDTTWTFPNNITSTAQVTVVAPTEGLVVTNMTNLIPGVEFAQNATYVAPTENDDEDYFLFGLTSQGTTSIPYQQGQKVPLFTFENGGVCTGETLYLMPIEDDPFAAPNSENANVGQQLTTAGSGIDANLCIVGEPIACVPCGPDATDTDGDGICDNEENNMGTDPFNPCDPDLFANNCDFECPELFNNQDTILMIGNGQNVEVCLDINPSEWSIYDIVVDEVPYTQPVMPCDNDTLIFYTYAFTTGQGNDGPYELQYWSVNGVPHSAIVQDMDELAMMMNQFDSGGNWINNPQFSAISGGQMNVMYGSMQIKHIETQITTFIQINYTFVAHGGTLEVPGTTGLHEVIATNDNGCADTLYIDIYNPTPETMIEVFTPDSTTTTFCVDNSQIPAGAFTTSICGMPSNGILTNNGNGCFEYLPNSMYVGTDEMCVVICSDTNPVICDTTYVTIDVDQTICDEIFGSDTLYVAAVNGESNICLNLASPEIDTYDILLDQTQYNQPLGQCNKDTLVFYTYAFVQGQGNAGPYEIESWTVNGNSFSTTVQDMDELAAWMNQVGVTNNWQNNDAYAAISGGSPSNNYGTMNIRHVQSGVPTQIQPNYTILVNGSEMNISGLGEHEVIINDPNTGCADTAIVILVEPMVDTITVTIPTTEPNIEICLDTDELPGNPATLVLCNNPDNGSISITGETCLTHTPDPNFIGEDEFCVIICDDSPAGGPFCDTTIVTVIVPPTTDEIGPITIDPVDTSVVCVTNELQYPGTITSSSICGENLLEVNVTPLIDGCFMFEPVIDFVGYSEVCVLNCYESQITGTEVCDTTFVTVFVPPVTDTMEVTLVEWMPSEVCVSQHINLAGNIQTISICGENPTEVDVEVASLECVTLSPQVGFQGTSEVCVVHCDNSIPAVCDTTYIIVNVDVPCPEIFDVDTIYTATNALCVPLSNTELDVYDVIINSAPYAFPVESCEEDTLVFYSYAFTQGAGSAGPYEIVSWSVNGNIYSGVVQDMDALAMQMNTWNPGATWINNDGSLSVSTEVMGDNYGNLILKRVATGVQTVMLPNFTQVAQGSELQLGEPGTYDVNLANTETGCEDNVIVIVIDVSPDTTITSTEANTPVGPFCFDNDVLPGNVTQTFCNSVSNGTLEFNDVGCLTYTPAVDFVGVEEICIVACSDVMTQEGTELCDTTTIQIVVLPQTNSIPVILETTNPTVVCLDNELEFPANIISSSVCGQNLSEMSVSTNVTNCISIEPVDDFVGVSDVCVMHCYEVLDISFCDTTLVSVMVLPPTDTIDVTITGYHPDTLCFSDYDVLQLPGNLMTVNVCGENAAQLNATVISGNCIELDPVQDIQGLTEVCMVHCDDSNPQFCDTTIIMINVEFPCPEYFEQDTIVVTNEKICAPIPMADFSFYDIIIDGEGYTFPPEPCNEDSLVYYTYSFTVGAGMSGPYFVNWEINGQDFSGSVQNMDELALLMSQWDAGETWVNDPLTASVRRESTGATFGTMILTHAQTSVPAFLNANYTSVALGTCLYLGETGWHEVIVTNNDTGCSDTVQVLYYNVDTETITVQTDNDTPTDPEICLDIDGLPGNVVSVDLCNGPSSGTVSLNGTCLTYYPTDFFSGLDEFCVVVCDDTPAPYGALCDTTYIQVQVGAPDCDPLFDDTSVTIDETPGTGTGTFCTPISGADFDIYEITMNGAPYTGTTTPCNIDSLVFYTYSFSVGAGQDGPYEMSSWNVNGQIFNGFVSNMDALTSLMNQVDPDGNWVNTPGTSSISGGSQNSNYGNMILTHVNTNIPATLMPNYTFVANGTALNLPVGTNNLVFTDTTNGCEDEITVIVNPLADGVLVTSRIFLQGAYSENTGMMDDDLRVQGYLPMSEPYTEYNPVSGVYRFIHVDGGGESTSSAVMSITGGNAVVDWVFLELRSAVDNEEIIATRSALLQRDGDIVDMDGVSPVLFDAPAGNYYLAVRHRNHLSIMSANHMPLSQIVTMVDFTDENTATWGQHAMKIMGNGQPVMWGGDVNGSGLLTFQGANNDPDAIFFSVLLAPGNPNFEQNYIYDGYHGSDANMDGQAVFQGTGNDIDFMIFFNVIGHPASGFVINYVVMEQLP